MCCNNSFFTASGTVAETVDSLIVIKAAMTGLYIPRAVGVISCTKPSTVTLLMPFFEMTAIELKDQC